VKSDGIQTRNLISKTLHNMLILVSATECCHFLAETCRSSG